MLAYVEKGEEEGNELSLRPVSFALPQHSESSSASPPNFGRKEENKKTFSFLLPRKSGLIKEYKSTPYLFSQNSRSKNEIKSSSLTLPHHNFEFESDSDDESYVDDYLKMMEEDWTTNIDLIWKDFLCVLQS